MMKSTIFAVAAAFVAFGGYADAQPSGPVLEREWWQRTDLREHIGNTYLQTFLAKTVGLHAKIVADYARTIEIVDADVVLRRMSAYDPRLRERTFGNFKDGEAGFKKALEGVEGQSIATKDLRDTIKPFTDAEAKSGIANFALSVAADMALLASGSGTLVRLDDNNYFYNVGFQDPIRFSGRSYGVSNDRKLFDPSDSDVLRELDAYLGPDNADPSPFYTVLLELLTSSDPSGIADLSPDAQALVTDFMLLYTAELDRNNMAGLSPTQWAWQSDLAEVTLLAAYGTVSGMALQNGALIECSSLAYEWFHGIGQRSAFMQLGRLITQYAKAKHPDLLFEIIALTPLTDADSVSFVDGDVFRRAVTFLNRPEAQEVASANAGKLTAAMVDLLRQVRTEQAAVTAFIKTKVPLVGGTCGRSKPP